MVWSWVKGWKLDLRFRLWSLDLFFCSYGFLKGLGWMAGPHRPKEIEAFHKLVESNSNRTNLKYTLVKFIKELENMR